MRLFRAQIDKPARKPLFAPRLDWVIAIAIILTAVACYFQEPLTTRQMILTDGDAGELFRSGFFDDREEHGGSRAGRIAGKPLDWSCKLTLKVKFGYCGFTLNFDVKNKNRGLDMRRFDKITFRLIYDGPGRSLRVAFKNRKDAYLALGAPSFDKRSQASAPVSQGEQDFELPFDQLSVAQWWRDGSTRQSPELARVDLDNVLSLELITGSESEPGNHRVHVKRVVLEDKLMASETWYAAVALTWVLIIAGIMLARRRETAKWREQLTVALQTTLDTIPHMVWSLDELGRFHFNGRWDEFTGGPVGGDPMQWLELIHPDELQPVSEAWEECSASGECFEIECRIKHKSGDYRWVLARAVPVLDAEGGAERWYGTCTDIHDRVEAQKAVVESVASERRKSEQLKWASEHDSLTGLPNRRAFHERLSTLFAAACHDDKKLGLLLVDLDHFKFINDSFGHKTGDALLCGVAQRLQSAVRSGDFVSRIGGDEFAILVVGARTEQNLQKLGDEVLNAIRAPLCLAQRVITPNASIGGAIFSGEIHDSDDFFETADAALYSLKRSGRGGVKLFQQYMLADIKRAAVQLSCAREVIADNRIIALYQPQVDLAHGRVVGFEALLRYRKSDSSHVGLPESLEEAFKDYELAAKLGELMQRRVASDVRLWIKKDLKFGRVSINAAPAEFLRDDYAERLLRTLDQNKVSPQHFDVEITEHAFLDRGPEYVARALKVLRQNGISISLDDFGTGSSSLSHLRDFSVDHVKIDQSFVGDIDKSQATASLVGGVVSLAHSLSLKVVAEGVETPAQRELLRVMGCDVGQGHLFSKPIPPADVDAFISQRTTSPALALRQQMHA